MAKLVWWLLLGVAVFALWRSIRRRTTTPVPPSSNAAPRPASPTGIQPMVRCDHCGVHLAASEALPAQGRHYCCEAHRRAGTADRTDR